MTPHLLGNDATWQQWCINTFSLYECQQWWVEGKWILELMCLWWFERMNNRIVRRRSEAERLRVSKQGRTNRRARTTGKKSKRRRK